MINILDYFFYRTYGFYKKYGETFPEIAATGFLSYYLGKDNNKTDAELVFSINNGNLYVVVFTKALDIKAFINDMMRKL